jgi:hypothetical protein
MTHYVNAPWCWGPHGYWPPAPLGVLRRLVWVWPELTDREATFTEVIPGPGPLAEESSIRAGVRLALAQNRPGITQQALFP